MSRLRRLSALLLIAYVLDVLIFAQPDPAQNHDPALDRLLRWCEDVRLHTPGYGDPPATEVGSWSRSQLTMLVADIKRLSGFLQHVRESRIGRVATIEFYGRRFTREQAEQIFAGNDTLLRGAVLHADIAVFVGNDFTRRVRDLDAPANFVVDDGRRTSGVEYQTAHWQVGRSILDCVTPAPAADAGVRLWYRATSAFLLRGGNLGQEYAHLQRALQLFPDDTFLLLDSGFLHQKFSSPTLQAAVQDLRAGGANPALGSRRAELELARSFFEHVLAADPAHVEARLRLGQTLGELELHQEATVHLRKALAATLTGPQLYYAELFLGREESALGRAEEAQRHFENAAELYPRAQSPRFALSELARRSGDRQGALRTLRAVISLPLTPFNNIDRRDPWWEYYEVHLDDTESLMEKMRALGRAHVP
jgi:hypothetical protein